MGGEAYVNFLGGFPLNRLSWLRTSQPFLNAVVQTPATRWLLFSAGQPLLHTPAAGAGKPTLAALSTPAVRPILGAEPLFGQTQKEGEIAEHDVLTLEAARLRGPPIVFLGLHEPVAGADALPSSEFSAKSPEAVAKVLANIQGTPYFSLDVTDVAPAEVNAVLRGAESNGARLEFAEPRGAMSHFTPFEAALFANARSMTDWNARSKFCPACGSPVYSLWAGWKLQCSSLLPWADNTGKTQCPTARGLHNFSHPRTDAVVIMAVIDEAGEKILLGRNKRFPGKFYSTLAGFIEPGESFEDAVKREIWEEAGVKVWNVRYHSTQPWPYPANLMVGFFATASSAQPLRIDLDNELDDARWYTRAEILDVLEHPAGTTLSPRDNQTMSNAVDGQDNVNKETLSTGENARLAARPGEPSFRVPPLTAIAGVLISEWAHGRAGLDVDAGTAPAARKGNL